MSSISWIIAISSIVLVAVIADLFLMNWLKRTIRIHSDGDEIERDGVFLFGVYSPVLSWLSQWVKVYPKGVKKLRQFEKEEKITAEETAQPLQPAAHNELIKIVLWLERQGVWLEVSVLVIAVFFYCIGILNIGTTAQLPGNESELFQSVDWLLYHAIRDFHQFPLWNPFIHTGLPYIGDPMLHIYNPVVTVPSLLFGVRNGFKLGLALSFLLAALGMWRLGKTLGFGKLPSLWIALMYTFAGQPVARFFQGEYLFVFGFAWIPWIIANLFSFIKERKKKYFTYTAFSLALLYFCGNAYYPFLMAFIVLIFFLVMVISLKKSQPFVVIDKKLLASLALLGVFSLGLIAIHFLPMLQFWPWMSKGVDVQGSHTLWQIWLDYTSKDTYRPDAYEALPAREEFYAYIGYVPFIGLLLTPFAFWKREKRPLVFLCLVCIFTYLWIDVDQMPWKDFFYNTHYLSQFRHVLRPLILGSFAIFILAGYGIDTVWKGLRQLVSSSSKSIMDYLNIVAAGIGLVFLVVLMAMGVWDVFSTNGQYVQTEEDYPPAYQVMGWLRNYDGSEYYVRNNPTNGWLYAVISSNLRFIDAWYHWGDIRKFDDQINHRSVQAKPNYIVQSNNEPPQTENGAYVIKEILGYDIYYLPESLPMAFTVGYDTLIKDNADELHRSDVTPLTPFFSGTNTVEIIAQGKPGDELVLLVTKYPGWKLTVDGKPAEVENVGGYLATRMQNGVHQYRFEFRPVVFYIGLIISLLSLSIGLGLIAADYQLNKRRLLETWQTLPAWLEKQKIKRWFPAFHNPVMISGVYENGVFQPKQDVAINNKANVHMLVVADREAESMTHLAWRQLALAARNLVHVSLQAISLTSVLFSLAIGVYLLTRLIGLTKFPIYFFTDEAIQTLSAIDFVKNGFRSPDGQLFPTYFQNDNYYNLSVSVYLQVIPYLLFGKSILVTRSVSALVSVLAALGVAFSLKNIFKVSLWWLTPALLAVVPAWFLHSRTAFETVIFVSFYAVMLYCYLLYRYQSPKYIYLTLIMAGLAFYSYSPGQVITAFTGLLLLFSDLGYHWKNRRYIPAAIILSAVIALPYIRFRMTHGDIATEHLKLLASYWIQPIPLSEKLRQFFSQYLFGLSPKYWFIPNQHDLIRHLMKGYGQISMYWLPFVTAGIGVCLWNFRSSMHRVILIAVLAAPVGGALVGIGITRVLVMVIPATLLMALGLDTCIKWIAALFTWIKEKNSHVRILQSWVNPTNLFSLILLFIFSLISFSTMSDALRNGPTWYRDYGMGGLQFGAPQIFYAVDDYLDQHPNSKIILSPSWANGTDIVARYFLDEDQPVKLGSINGYLFEHLYLEENTVFVMIPEEYEKAIASGKFANIDVEKTVKYPDGRTGFYFAKVRYVDNIDQILALEKEIRRRLKESDVNWLGQTVHVRYSPLDMGEIVNIFDGDDNTLVRTAEANPAIYEIKFSQPIKIKEMGLFFGSTEAGIELILYPADGSTPVKIETTLFGSVDKPKGSIKLSKELIIESFQLKLTDTRQQDPGNVHLWDITIID